MAAKTYVALASIPTGNSPGQTPIKQCSAVLENHMQCWNASSFLVKTQDAKGKPMEYQLCRRHAMIEQSQPVQESKILDTTSDATEVTLPAEPAKPVTKVVAESKSSFKPAPPKQETEETQQNTPNATSDSTPATKPLLQPKTPKPAAF